MEHACVVFPGPAHGLAATALTAVVLSTYVMTTAPSVPGGDSGEMVQLAAELGVAHPPGYPTWTMLAHAFSWLPHGEIGWRINLFSAVCGAFSSGLLVAAVANWSGCVWTGIAAGGAFAFAPLVWLYAVQAEVFALNNLCNALLLFLLTRFSRSRTLVNGCAGAWAIGLGMTNQHTIIFFCVPYAIWALYVGRKQLGTPRAFGLLCLAGLAGLAPYAYLVIQGGPGAAWGSWGDQRSLGGLLTHVLRREYGTFRLANTPSTTDSEFGLRLRTYLQAVPSELPPLGAPLLLIGLVHSLAVSELRPLGVALLAAYVLYVGVFLYLSNLPVSSAFYLQIQQRFWPQAHLLCSVWYALGLRLLVMRLGGQRHGAWGLPIASLLLVGTHAAAHYDKSDLSSNTVFRQVHAPGRHLPSLAWL